MIRTKKKCEYCDREISLSNLTKHIETHFNGSFDKKQKSYHIGHDDLFCKFCGKECKSRIALSQHELRCKDNPERKAFDNLTQYIQDNGAWNKGLTKETDERVKLHAIKVAETFKEKGYPWQGKHHSPETIAKLKQNAGGPRPGAGRGKSGQYKGYWCDSTYELVYVIYNLDHNIKFERCNLCYQYFYDDKVHNYYPDFILEDGTIIEIKGYYTEQVKAKTDSVNDREIKVLYKRDLEYMFEYVKNNYQYNELSDLYE